MAVYDKVVEEAVAAPFYSAKSMIDRVLQHSSGAIGQAVVLKSLVRDVGVELPAGIGQSALEHLSAAAAPVLEARSSLEAARVGFADAFAGKLSGPECFSDRAEVIDQEWAHETVSYGDIHDKPAPTKTGALIELQIPKDPALLEAIKKLATELHLSERALERALRGVSETLTGVALVRRAMSLPIDVAQVAVEHLGAAIPSLIAARAQLGAGHAALGELHAAFLKGQRPVLKLVC